MQVHQWVSNFVPVEKKDSRKLQVYVDFRVLNRSTPEDEYPMTIADILLNDALGHWVITFFMVMLITNYNKIFMAKEDASKMAFIYLSFVGLFEWVVMTFCLKNVGHTYLFCKRAPSMQKGPTPSRFKDLYVNS
jgi:hypothetical protein